jgi:uncharacterized repeat protein (TIGR03943 family)
MSRPPRTTLTRNVFFAAVYGAWWLTLLSFLLSRAYTSFILPAFAPLLWGALVMLTLFIAAGFSGQPAVGVRQEDVVRGTVLLLPLVALWLAQGSSLDSYAYYRRALGLNGTAHAFSLGGPASAPPAAGVALRRPHHFREPAENTGEPAVRTSVLELVRRPRAFNGKLVTLDGMATRPDGISSDTFILFRFIIVCCVADSRPLGVRVLHPEAEQVEDSGWYSVTGRFTLGRNGEGTISEARVREMEEPPDPPYLYEALPLGRKNP